MKLKQILFITATLFALVYFGVFTTVEKNKLADTQKKIRSTSSPKASYKTKKARLEYFYNMLRDPETKEIPQRIRQKELSFAKNLQENSKSLNKANQLNWQEVGPNNVGGRTRALVVDAADPNTIIVGGASGGIWKSIDKGNSWTMKSSTSQVLSVTTLAQDPRPGQTNNWYYGTGEFRGSAGDQGQTHFFSGDGIYKSTDNGETWNVLPLTLSNNFAGWDSPFDWVSKIEINPVTGSIFVAATGFGIFKSSDGGNSFSLAIGGPYHHYMNDISIASNGTMVAVLATQFPNQNPQNSPGVYKSTDDGNTWTNITPSSFPQTHLRSEVEIAPSNPDVAYVVTFIGNNPSGQYEDIAFHKINISSGSAEDRSSNLPTFPNGNGQERINTQGAYNLTLAVKPDDENFVLIGATSLFRSTNGFSTKPNDTKQDWIGGYHPIYFGYPNLHPDIHSYCFEPNNPNALWLGHDGGLSYTSDIASRNFSDIFPWEKKNNGYNITQFYHITIPKNPGDNRIMGGTQDNGTPFLVYNGTIGPQIADVSSGDGAYSYFGQSHAYTSVYNGIMMRLGYDNNNYPNGQAGYSEITPTGATGQLFINSAAIDPNNEDIIYYPAGNNLWRNDQLSSIPEAQQGTTIGWTKLDNLALPNGYVISAISVSESNPAHRIYYGGTDLSPQSTGELKMYRLDNANTSTSGAVELSIPGLTKGSFLNSIAINPNNADEIIAVFSNYNIVGVYHSLDGGQSFSPIEGNLKGDENLPGPSTRAAVILPNSNSTQYFLATTTGVYSTSSLNGTNTVWNLEGSNTMGNVVVHWIDGRKSDGRIVAGTHGRGIFLATSGSGVGAPIASVNTNSLSLQSRPGQSGTTNFILSNDGESTLNYNISVNGNFGSFLPKSTEQKLRLKEVDINSPDFEGYKKRSKFYKFRDQIRSTQNNNLSNGPVDLNGDDYIFNDDGNATADLFGGPGNGYDFNWYNEFDVVGSSFDVEEIEFFIRSENSQSNGLYAAIHDKDANLLQAGYFTLDLSKEGKWYSVALNPKITFNSGDKFYIELLSYSLIPEPAGIDLNGQIPNKSFYFDYNYAAFVNLNIQSGFENGAFLIRAKGTQQGGGGGGGGNQNPLAVANLSTSQASVNEQITFDASQSNDSDGQISQYLWNFGDGLSSNQMTTSHSYSQAGTYNYSLTVTDDLGGTGQTSGQITIVSSNDNFVTVTPASGTIAPGSSESIMLTLNAQTISEGIYTGQVNITTNGGNIIIPIDYLVDVEKISSLPSEFNLSQNYPNPFNPTTTIQYSLPQTEDRVVENVSLVVYDVLGKEVVTLVNEKQSQGTYNVSFDASALTSGMYIYRLEAGNYQQTKKMILLK